MDRGAWWATAHGVAKSRTRLSDFTLLYLRQQKRHRPIEQAFGLCGRGRGWDDLGE